MLSQGASLSEIGEILGHRHPQTTLIHAKVDIAALRERPMNTLRQAVAEYLKMRRALGFALRDAGKGRLDFVTFMEQRQASYITQALALAWAQPPKRAKIGSPLSD